VRDNIGVISAADTVTIRVNPLSATTVTVNGRVTYARVPFRAQLGTGLDYGATFQDSARGIRVEARGSGILGGQCVFASTRTNATGDYSLVVPANQSTAIRAIAHLLRRPPEAQPHYDIAVRNWNADTLAQQPEPYSFTGQAFDSSAPNGNQNVQIPSGWNAATRQPLGPGERRSAPFAIIATIQRALDFLTAPAVTPAIQTFPVLNIDWSETKAAGQTFYSSAGGDPTNPSLENRYISLSGEAGADLDEFDQHTIAHEFGHYIEDRFSRSDSVGGAHTGGDVLDPRVAFGEGFGYAFAAMVLNDPIVRDAFGGGQSIDFNFNVESDDSVAEGWFSESSNQEILWDLFDPANEANDAAALGFGPLWDVLTGEQSTTPALTTIFSFGTALKALTNATEDAAINQLLQNEFTATNSDAFALNEVNHAGRTDVLPLYPVIAIGDDVDVISTDDFGSEGGNKLGARRYLRFGPTIGAGTATLNVMGGTPTHDIDVLVVRNGALVGFGTTAGNTETVQFSFTNGQVFVFEVYDCANAECNDTTPPGDTTINVSLN
jgi:hypothetical protein